MSLQLEKRGFNHNYHDQNMKIIRISAQLHLFIPNRAVRYLLCPVSRERPWQDLYRRPLGRICIGPQTEGAQKGP